MFKEIFQNRRLIYKLAKNDFKTRYAGSVFGTVWAFIQPLVTIAVYYFVFGFGLRGGQSDGNFPFVLYLVTGIVPWFFFQEALMGGTSSLIEYSYLVKKVIFNIRVLPMELILYSDFVLFCLSGFFDNGFVLYYQRCGGAVPGSGADHQYWAAGRRLAYADYVRRG